MRGIADPLRAERMATSRLVAVLLSEVEETRIPRRIDKAELILDKSPNAFHQPPIIHQILRLGAKADTFDV